MLLELRSSLQWMCIGFVGMVNCITFFHLTGLVYALILFWLMKCILLCHKLITRPTLQDLCLDDYVYTDAVGVPMEVPGKSEADH